MRETRSRHRVAEPVKFIGARHYSLSVAPVVGTGCSRSQCAGGDGVPRSWGHGS